MDSRIEELASIIKERCESYLEAVNSNSKKQSTSVEIKQINRKVAYEAIHRDCLNILFEIEQFRKKHPEDY